MDGGAMNKLRQTMVLVLSIMAEMQKMNKDGN